MSFSPTTDKLKKNKKREGEIILKVYHISICLNQESYLYRTKNWHLVLMIHNSEKVFCLYLSLLK